jgi:hypothetical protein
MRPDYKKRLFFPGTGKKSSPKNFKKNLLLVLVPAFQKWLSDIRPYDVMITYIGCSMKNREKRPVLWVVLSGLTGILVFLVLLVILGYLASYYPNTVLPDLFTLLVNNLALILTASVLFIIADIFYTFRFPFSIPAPLLGGLGSLFIVSLFFIIMDFFDLTYSLGISAMFPKIRDILYPLVFFIVVIAGYARIFFTGNAGCKQPGSADVNDPAACPSRKSWDDVGDEFRQAIYDFFHRIREDLNRK